MFKQTIRKCINASTMVQKSHNQNGYDAGTLLKVEGVDVNNTFLAVILDNGEVIHRNVTNSYDHVGASYYVTAVIMIYGLSIVFMIGSLVKRSKSDVDNSVNIYLKEVGLGSSNKFELRHKKAKARANLSAKLTHQNISSGLKLTSSIATVADGGKMAAVVKEGKPNYFNNPCIDLTRLSNTQSLLQNTPPGVASEDVQFPKCSSEYEGGDSEGRTFQRQSSSSTVKLEPLFEEVEVEDDDDDDLFQTEHAVLMV
ncbi:unnamed protein product [Owenia fusiformis]|uniref:Uncharacterized protein n=1 Tax=Owenia fusiformis TaxID=6347 RepID=A0A8J1USD2_OWEFU|nr:unnamed protein product [Owenia fusiformis]